MELIRSDGEVIVASATGYIRDLGDHEQSSHNLTGIDPSPITDGSYRVMFTRESGSANPVFSDPVRSLMTVRVFESAAGLPATSIQSLIVS